MYTCVYERYREFYYMKFSTVTKEQLINSLKMDIKTNEYLDDTTKVDLLKKLNKLLI